MAKRTKTKRLGRQWVCRGGPWVYRRPVRNHGKWRVRRRTIAGDRVETMLLKDATDWTSATEAVRKLAKDDDDAEKARLAGQGAAPPGESTLDDAVKAWVADRAPNVRPTTLAKYKMDAELFARLLGGEKRVREITFAELNALYVGAWKGLRGRTKLKYRAQLIVMFTFWQKMGWCGGNPAALVTPEESWKRQVVKAARETGRALSVEEVRRILDACLAGGTKDSSPDWIKKRAKVEPKLAPVEPRTDLWWLTLAGVLTGLRLSNLVGADTKRPLSWGDVDLEHEEVRIEANRMKGDEDYHVPLVPEFAYHLRRRLRELGRVPDPAEPVLPVERTGRLVRSFHRLCRQAEVPPCRLHDLRHTAISLWSQYLPFSAVQTMAGHAATSNITLRYVHPSLAQLHEAVKALPWITGKAAETKSLAPETGGA